VEQIKAEFEVVVAPVGEDLVPSDFQFVDSFACAPPLGFGDGMAAAVGELVEEGDAGPVYTTDEIRFFWVKPKTFTDLHGYKLNVTVPGDAWLDGTVLDLSADPDAFAAWLLHVEYSSPIGLDYDAAWIEAVATSGTIAIDYAADPCSGSGCEPATGSMDIWFELRRVQIDETTVPPL